MNIPQIQMTYPELANINSTELRQMLEKFRYEAGKRRSVNKKFTTEIVRMFITTQVYNIA